jgi:hypothetical protein
MRNWHRPEQARVNVRRARERTCNWRGCTRQADGRDLFCAEHQEQLRLRQVPPASRQPQAAPEPDNDWLGGGRTIILRE